VFLAYLVRREYQLESRIQSCRGAQIRVRSSRGTQEGHFGSVRSVACPRIQRVGTSAVGDRRRWFRWSSVLDSGRTRCWTHLPRVPWSWEHCWSPEETRRCLWGAHDIAARWEEASQKASGLSRYV